MVNKDMVWDIDLTNQVSQPITAEFLYEVRHQILCLLPRLCIAKSTKSVGQYLAAPEGKRFTCQTAVH